MIKTKIIFHLEDKVSIILEEAGEDLKEEGSVTEVMSLVAEVRWWTRIGILVSTTNKLVVVEVLLEVQGLLVREVEDVEVIGEDELYTANAEQDGPNQ